MVVIIYLIAAYTQWCEIQKHLVDERGRRRMARLVQVNQVKM